MNATAGEKVDRTSVVRVKCDRRILCVLRSAPEAKLVHWPRSRREGNATRHNTHPESDGG